MKKVIIAALVAASFNAAASNTGNVVFERDVAAVCGLTIQDANGQFAYQGETVKDTAVLRFQNNKDSGITLTINTATSGRWNGSPDVKYNLGSTKQGAGASYNSSITVGAGRDFNSIQEDAPQYLTAWVTNLTANSQTSAGKRTITGTITVVCK